MTLSLNVLTLNIWGLGFGIAEDRAARVAALCEVLPTLGVAVVALQEVWVPADQHKLAREGGFAHHHYFASGRFGSGLLLLSRYPILETHFQPYRMLGRPQNLTQGDYYAGKGIGLARVETEAGPVDIYNTHALAQYAPDERDDLAVHRLSNMYEAAAFMDTRSRQNPLVAMGDFNVRPDQDGYRLVTAYAGLTDVYMAANPNDAGYTSVPENPYKAADQKPKRLDYIFSRDGQERGWQIESADLCLKLLPHSQQMAYSDHYGVRATLRLGTPDILPPADITPLLTAFSDRLDQSLGETSARQATAQRRGVLALIAALSLAFAPTGERSQLRQFLAGTALVYALWQAFVALVSGNEELRALRAIRAEVISNYSPIKNEETT